MIGVCLGHADYLEREENKIRIKAKMVELIKKGVDEFYLGGMGNFDYCCASYLRDLKKEYPHIKLFLIQAYYKHNLDKDTYKEISLKYDGTIYPPLEKVPPKFAIVKRNKWMIDQADYIIFYVDYSFTNSYKFMEYANKKKKSFTNFGCVK